MIHWDEVVWLNNVLSKIFFFPFQCRSFEMFYILLNAVIAKLSQFRKIVIRSNYLFPSETGQLIEYILSNSLT